MTGLFEVLASTDDPAGSRAVIAAQTRAKEQFGRYVGSTEVDSRLSFIADDIKKMAAEVASEYGYDDPEKLYLAATVALGGGHAADCTCGFCENKGSFGKNEDEDEEEGEEKTASAGDADGPVEKADGNKKCGNCGAALKDNIGYDTCPTCGKHLSKTACSCPAHDGGECNCGDDCDCEACHKKESSFRPRTASTSVSPRQLPLFDWERIAAGPETGDSYQQETIDLPAADASGLGGPSPKIDKAKSGDEAGWNLEPIDVDSKRNQLEHQDATDRAEYNAADFDPQNPVTKRIDADEVLQPEFNVADKTKTWSDKGTQADPVTSKWKLLG